MMKGALFNLFWAVLLLLNSSFDACAHTYYEGLTDMNVNISEDRTEIVHRFTTHDLEIFLSKKLNRKITADTPSYSDYIEQYIKQSFTLKKEESALKVEWIGIENGISETIIYQVVSGLTNLSGIVVRNEILTGFYPKQVNRTNYKDQRLVGTLIFENGNSQKIE